MSDPIAQLLTEQFITVMKSDKNKSNTIAALRALSVLQQGAADAEPTLIELLTTTTDHDILIATANALAQLQVERKALRPGDIVTACTPHFESLDQWPRYFKGKSGLQLLRDEVLEEYSVAYGPRFGGGGGGFGGGGQGSGGGFF